MQRRISSVIARVNVRTGFSKQTHTFHACTVFISVAIFACREHSSLSFAVSQLQVRVRKKYLAYHRGIPRLGGIDKHTLGTVPLHRHTTATFRDDQLAEISMWIGSIGDQRSYCLYFS